MKFVRCHPLAISVAFLVLTTTLHAENWPGFRGPTRQGVSSEKHLPLRWTASENIAWKAELSGEGWSSPIVWEDRVFLSGTTDEGRSCHIICFDRRDGKVLWDRQVFEQTPTRKEGKNSYASPTPATDGERVYAAFSSGGIVAVSFDGDIVWTNRDHKHYSKHGLGASPILFEDLLIMPFDGSSQGEDIQVGWKKPWDQAVLLALDKRTGEVRWQGKRGLSRIAHVTPNILEHEGQTQIISGAGDVIQGFDPHTGERIWSVHSQGEGVTPSVVIGDGLIYTCSGFEKPTIRVVRPGGKGDVTQTHIVWEQTKGVPSLSSLLYVKPYLYAVTDAGVASCYDAKTGDLVWQDRLGGNYSASPVFADGRVYFLSEQGDTVVIEPGAEFKELARNPLGEKCQASMAVSQGRFFIRTEQHLFCIGK